MALPVIKTTTPKDPKRLVRERYKRSLKNLAHALKKTRKEGEELLSLGARPKKTASVEETLAAIEALRSRTDLPDVDHELTQSTADSLCDIFDLPRMKVD